MIHIDNLRSIVIYFSLVVITCIVVRRLYQKHLMVIGDVNYVVIDLANLVRDRNLSHRLCLMFFSGAFSVCLFVELLIECHGNLFCLYVVHCE
jgi:hypothetical protein